MLRDKKLALFCFSPPVMVATFLIEIILLLALVVRYKMNRITRLIALSLFALAFFQLAEYFVCGGLGVDAQTWSRLGFVAITTLPPLGLHIIYSIKKTPRMWPVWGSYALMAVWIGVFALSQTAFRSHECAGNYVVFNLQYHLSYFYSAYYYGILLLGIAAALHFAQQASGRQKQALLGMIAGYLVFLLPTAVVNTINPATMAGIPSIMCGFAVVFALILFFYITPRVAKPKK